MTFAWSKVFEVSHNMTLSPIELWQLFHDWVRIVPNSNGPF